MSNEEQLTSLTVKEVPQLTCVELEATGKIDDVAEWLKEQVGIAHALSAHFVVLDTAQDDAGVRVSALRYRMND